MEVRGIWKVSQGHESMRRRRMNETGVVRMMYVRRKRCRKCKTNRERKRNEAKDEPNFRYLGMAHRTHRPTDRIGPLRQKRSSAQTILCGQTFLLTALAVFPSVLQEFKSLSSLVRALWLCEHGLPFCAIRENYPLARTCARSTLLALRCADIEVCYLCTFGVKGTVGRNVLAAIARLAL